MKYSGTTIFCDENVNWKLTKNDHDQAILNWTAETYQDDDWQEHCEETADFIYLAAIKQLFDNKLLPDSAFTEIDFEDPFTGDKFVGRLSVKDDKEIVAEMQMDDGSWVSTKQTADYYACIICDFILSSMPLTEG